MKKMVLLSIIMLVVISMPMMANKYDAYVDGIYYNLNQNDKTASVTSDSYRYTGRINIPPSITYNNITYSVTSIGYYAFYGCTDLISVTIPNSVIEIGPCAFGGCTKLTSIKIPKSVKIIDGHAFTNTGWYNNQPNGLLYLDSCLVGLKGSVGEEVIIKEGTRLIAGSTFGNCQNLAFINIPQSVTSIGSAAFCDCSSLVTINIPDAVTIIGTDAFNGCSGLIDVTIGTGLRTIGAQAFNKCTNLKTINIPDGVTSIGNRAFYNCTSLSSSIKIPDGVTFIDEYTFYNCSSLKSVILPNTLKSIGNYAFCLCGRLTSANIPDSVTAIGENAYNLCTSLETLTLPKDLKIIKKETFLFCKALKSLTIPAEIKYIYANAFNGCDNIQEVIALPEAPPLLYDNSFSNYAITLKVPDSSKEAYMSSSPWNKFKEIIALEKSQTETPKCEQPTISYENGQLKFASATEGAKFVSEITDADIKNHYDATISLTVTYNISVYATKADYTNSDIATATLCWIESEPKSEGITNGVAHVPAKAILIQSEDGFLKVEGVDDGTPVSVFTSDGKQAGSGVSHNGAALVGTNIQSGTVAIVKINNQSVKVVIK